MPTQRHDALDAFRSLVAELQQNVERVSAFAKVADEAEGLHRSREDGRLKSQNLWLERTAALESEMRSATAQVTESQDLSQEQVSQTHETFVHHMHVLAHQADDLVNAVQRLIGAVEEGMQVQSAALKEWALSEEQADGSRLASVGQARDRWQQLIELGMDFATRLGQSNENLIKHGVLDHNVADEVQRQKAWQLNAMAVRMFHAHRPQTAELLLRQAVALQPGDGRLWRNLAAAQLTNGDLCGASESLKRAQEEGAEGPDVWHVAGLLALAEGDAELALGWLQKCVDQDPKLVPYRISLAQAAYAANCASRGEREWDAIVGCEPGLVYARPLQLVP